MLGPRDERAVLRRDPAGVLEADLFVDVAERGRDLGSCGDVKRGEGR